MLTELQLETTTEETTGHSESNTHFHNLITINALWLPLEFQNIETMIFQFHAVKQPQNSLTL